MIANLIAGHWRQPHTPTLPVYNPATAEVLDEVPLSGPVEVAQAVAAAPARRGSAGVSPERRVGYPPP